MANHFRMEDPMDTKFTNPAYTVDLTAPKKSEVPVEEVKPEELVEKAVKDEETVTLESIMEDKPKAKVIMDNHKLSDQVQEFDPTTLIPRKEIRDEGANEVFANLDAAVDRTKREITEFHKDLEARMYEDFVEKETEAEASYIPSKLEPVEAKEDDDDDDDLIHETPTVDEPKKIINIRKDEDDEEEVKEEKPVSVYKTVESEFSYDEAEMDKDLEEIGNEDTEKAQEDADKAAEEYRRKLSAAAKGVFRSNNAIDLSKFSIGTQPIKASTVIVNNASEQGDIADWIMYDADKAIAARGLTGAELIKLNTASSDRNVLNALKDVCKIIYDHIVDDKKPDYYTWMKQTKFSDLDHLYFALYMATFHGSNFISYQCPDCKKVFIKEVPFQDCVKYKNDEIKEKVRAMQNQTTDNGIIPYDIELLQVSDKFVFGMKIPSLYTVSIETSSIPRNIIEKYSDLIDTIAYIDAVYTIDYTNMQLIPVAIPVVNGDIAKTAGKRIKTMYDIIKSLTPDEFSIVSNYIEKKAKGAFADVSYQLPGAKCPDCDGEIPPVEANGEALLFTRHQLGAFASL